MKLHSLLLGTLALLPAASQAQSEYTDTTAIHTIFDGVTFYDGYRVNDFSAGIDSTADVLHHTTYLYAKKLTDEVLNNIGQYVSLNVWVKACCDNYDRLGNINLALVPKDSTTYSIDSPGVQRIELGRFITPFMDKNKQPDTCPYVFGMHYLSLILRDAELRSKYNFWLEYELFGVPYAAQTQIDGCEGRSDVFQGSLQILTTKPALEETNTNVLVPINMKTAEWRADHGLNNYNEACTDTLGKTVKTWTFTVPKDCADAQIVLVSSNHGSNSGGEEYNRRTHYVYYDNELTLTYRPGGKSCEPYRKYNTQANGIYGTSRSDLSWKMSSNWCPGDAIDNRIISLGAVKAGEHKICVSVPTAVFNGGQGYIPVSIFFQGVTEGVVTAIDNATVDAEPVAEVAVRDGRLMLSLSDRDNLANVELYDVQGKKLYTSATADAIDLTRYPKGVYLINIETADGLVEVHKVFNK